jgi:SAM-dependent methyltransferase
MHDDSAVPRPPGGQTGGGYTAGTYGAAFADVYDEWYGGLAGTEAAVAMLAELALSGPAAPVLELGVGTGRLAVPLAERLARHGRAVHGVDASQAMVARMHAKPGAAQVTVTIGDMAGDDPPGPFGLVFVAVNTFFNLDSERAQRRCLASVAGRLVPGGLFVVEASVPDTTTERARDHVGISSISADRLVLTASREDLDDQIVTGQHVELVDGCTVQLRPWRIRWVTPAQLDAMAADMGLVLLERYASWERETFSTFSPQHVSVFRR